MLMARWATTSNEKMILFSGGGSAPMTGATPRPPQAMRRESRVGVQPLSW